MLIASARGGVYTGDSAAAASEHHESYLLAALGLIGLTDVTVIRAEGLAVSEDTKTQALTAATQQIDALAA